MEHTAELELRIEGESPRHVFENALAAFAELVADDGREERAEHALWLTASDRGSLLVQWLEELVYLADAKRFVPERAESLAVGGKELRAHVHGYVGSPRPLVKAVTYHGLEFRRHLGAWHARVVFDV